MIYEKISKKFIKEFWQLVKEADSIALVSHISPDGDAISSLLSMRHILNSKFSKKKIKMACSGHSTERFNSFKGYEDIVFVKDVESELEDIDLIIFLDAGEYSRFSKNADEVENLSAKKIVIDHHGASKDKFDLVLNVPEIHAAAEIVYRCFGEEVEMNKILAEYFLLGILDDTGNLAFLGKEQLETFDIVKKMLGVVGTGIQEFQMKYGGISRNVFDLIEILMDNAELRYLSGWPGFQTSYIPREILAQRKYTDNEMSEAIHVYVSHFLYVVHGYDWGFVVYPKPDGTCRASFRSLPKTVDVKKLTSQMGIGGGHVKASGAKFEEEGRDLEPSQCINKVISWMREHEA